MCGILGIFVRRAEIDCEAVELARDSMRHRGPDGAGVWLDRIDNTWRIALAHRRLSILDLSPRGAQPMLVDTDGNARPARYFEEGSARLSLIFNGEIYNYLELRTELKQLGYSFHSSGDSEVLLRAYQAWGVASLPRLNGMFAFAIWDRLARTVFCARDRFGEKPLHYVLDDRRGVFAFASEVKALVAIGAADGDLNKRAVYRYFRFGEQEGVDQTIWQHVKRIPPASHLTVRFDEEGCVASAGCYWRIDPNETRSIRFSDATDQFRHLFRESIRLRLRSDVPLGTSLSGGLDSSSVLCTILSEGAEKGQQSFSARMEDPTLDEGQYIKAVLDGTAIPGHEVVPTADALIQNLDDLFFHQEEPFPTTSVFASYLVQRLAREQGVVVMLDGQGADEYLAGYAHYPALVLADLATRGRLLNWFVERRALARRSGVDPVPPRAALYYLARPRRDRDMIAVDNAYSTECLSDDMNQRFRDEAVRTVSANGNRFKTRLYADLMLGHLQELLRYADRNSMAFSRELRLPFLDHRLVEFAISLPRSFLFSRGESKRILRAAMRGIVPDVIVERRDKVGFVVPWNGWWSGSTHRVFAEQLARAQVELDGIAAPGRAEPGSRDAFSLISLAASWRNVRRLARPGAWLR
jgi:asparagine synthase (glutamine-hydrolysing)